MASLMVIEPVLSFVPFAAYAGVTTMKAITMPRKAPSTRVAIFLNNVLNFLSYLERVPALKIRI